MSFTIPLGTGKATTWGVTRAMLAWTLAPISRCFDNTRKSSLARARRVAAGLHARVIEDL